MFCAIDQMKKRRSVRTFDGRMIDMGIDLCHFQLAAKECGMNIEFIQKVPAKILDDAEYIASYRLI